MNTKTLSPASTGRADMLPKEQRNLVVNLVMLHYRSGRTSITSDR